MEQKRAACVYMPINGSNKVGPVDPDPGLDELSQFDNRISKSELEAGSDTRSDSTDSSITQTTSTTGSEIAIHGSSSSSEKHTTDRNYHQKNDNDPGSGAHFYDNRNRQFRYKKRSEYEVNRTLWVGNVPIWASEQQMIKIFAKVGAVRHVYMPKKPTKRDECKFAFVGYYREESVPRALEELHGATLFGKVLKLAARHGSIHEIQALELEKKRENVAKPKSRKDELKQVRELAKLRMKMATSEDLHDQVCNKDALRAGYYSQCVAMAPTLSTFQRHALEFQERQHLARFQSSAEEKVFRKWESGSNYPEEDLTKYLFEIPTGHHQKRTVEYKPLSGHSFSPAAGERLAPCERAESPGDEVERFYDIDDSFWRKLCHERGQSYYNNEVVKQKVDHEERKQKRRLEYDYHYRQRKEKDSKKMRYSRSRERYSRSSRRDEPKIRRNYDRNSDVRPYRNHPRKANRDEVNPRRIALHKSYERRIEMNDHCEQPDQDHSRRSGSGSEPPSSTGANSSTLVTNYRRDHRNYSEIDSDESLGFVAGTGSGGSSDKQTSSGPEVAPGSVGCPSTSSCESVATSASATAATTALLTGIGVGSNMQPEDMARMILSNLDIESLNTVAATMGLHVTTTGAANVNAPIPIAGQNDSLPNGNEATQKVESHPKKYGEMHKTEDKTGKALCRIM